jgi:hypothetical protein
MSTHRGTGGNRLLTAEEVGKILNPTDFLTPASAREEINRAGITEARGYPAEKSHIYARGRPSRGRWGHK